MHRTNNNYNFKYHIYISIKKRYHQLIQTNIDPHNFGIKKNSDFLSSNKF